MFKLLKKFQLFDAGKKQSLTLRRNGDIFISNFILKKHGITTYSKAYVFVDEATKEIGIQFTEENDSDTRAVIFEVYGIFIKIHPVLRHLNIDRGIKKDIPYTCKEKMIIFSPSSI